MISRLRRSMADAASHKTGESLAELFRGHCRAVILPRISRPVKRWGGFATCFTTKRAEFAVNLAEVSDMSRRPVTLFTGQWADLPLEKLCGKAKSFGYDGLELACWGDHFEVDQR